MRSRVWIAAGVLGWILFGVSLWYHHKPPTPEYIPPATADRLRDEGFTEGDVSKRPPPKVVTKTVKVPGAERIVYVEVEAQPTEAAPPEVRYVRENCTEPTGPQAPNWTLRPGDLGLRDGSVDIVKAGRRPFVAFTAIVTAQTPGGVSVERKVEPNEKAWVSTAALGIPPRFGPYVHATTLPTVESGLYWTRGRVQYDAGAGYDFDRRRWFGGGGARF